MYDPSWTNLCAWCLVDIYVHVNPYFYTIAPASLVENLLFPHYIVLVPSSKINLP